MREADSCYCTREKFLARCEFLLTADSVIFILFWIYSSLLFKYKSGAMELPHIGQNCALKSCNRLDFLPVKCDACSGVYCLEHYRYEGHSCDKARDKDFQVPVCPLCLEPVTGKRDQLPDIFVSEHIDRYCKFNEYLPQSRSGPQKQRSNLQACSHKLCKQKDLIYLECGDCKRKFCIRHRHPADHSCSRPPAPPLLSQASNSFATSIGSSITQNLKQKKLWSWLRPSR